LRAVFSVFEVFARSARWARSYLDVLEASARVADGIELLAFATAMSGARAFAMELQIAASCDLVVRAATAHRAII
jgi:hypothetical protein